MTETIDIKVCLWHGTVRKTGVVGTENNNVIDELRGHRK